jgi:hypothetical protein
MFNNIIDAICTVLADNFDYPVHTDIVEQGLEMPCFFVSSINPKSELYIGRRYKRNYLFSVQFMTESENADLYSIVEQLEDLLEVIDVKGDLYRGNNTDINIRDGLLTFTINYPFFVYKELSEKAEEMEELEEIQNIKE